MHGQELANEIIAAKNDIAHALTYCHRGNTGAVLSSLKRCHRTTGKIITLLGEENRSPSVSPPAPPPPETGEGNNELPITNYESEEQPPYGEDHN